MKQVLAEVISNKQILGGFERPHAQAILRSNLMWLRWPGIETETVLPGKFVMVRCGESTVLPRPFSIHGFKEDRMALFYSVLEKGRGTNWLSQRRAGDKIELFGPLGNGFSIQAGAKNLLLVAGGIGIAPLAFLAEVAASRGCAVKLHQGVNTAGQISLDALLSRYTFVPSSSVPGVPAAATQYASPGTIECTASTVDGSAFVRGLATICLPGLAAEADQVFACGPVAMYKAMAQMTELKRKSVQVSLEVVMGCGRGVCYGCTIKTQQGLKEVCSDGPVFDLDDILWGELNL